MTEEIMKTIAEAERKATEIKAKATERATQIVKEAEARAVEIEKSSAEVCKAYRETAQKNAEAEAQKQYVATLEKAQAEASEYCRKILNQTEAPVSKIVGRITNVDC